MKKLTLIVAMTPSGIIAIDGKIPWKVSEDLKRFKALTMGHAIIMGRKTFESIGRPLPGRKNIVVTRDLGAPWVTSESARQCDIAGTVEGALGAAYEFDDAPFVIGGAEIYAQTLSKATHLEVTYVIRDYDRAQPGSTEHLPLKREVRRFSFKNAEAGPPGLIPHSGVRFGIESYPSMWDWRCTKVERALDTIGEDVEFHSFERRS